MKYRPKKLPSSEDEFMERLDLKLIEYQPMEKYIFERQGRRVMSIAIEKERGAFHVVVELNYEIIIAKAYKEPFKFIFGVVYLDIAEYLTKGMTYSVASRKMYRMSRSGIKAGKRAVDKLIKRENEYYKKYHKEYSKKYNDIWKNKTTYLEAGEKVKELRLQRGLTLKKVSDSMGGTIRTITGWEKGRSRPNNENMRKLSIYYDISYLEIKDWYDKCEKERKQ